MVTDQCQPTMSPCPAELWHGTVGSDSFTPVTQFALTAGSVVLALHDRTGYLVTSSSSSAGPPGLLVTRDGSTWVPQPDPCPAYFGLTVAPVDDVRAAMLCSGNGAAGSTTKVLLATSDAGRTWVREGTQAPLGGDGGQLSAADVGTLAIATSSAAAEIYRTVNGGATWTTVLQLNDGGVGWGDFGFTDSAHGLAVHDPANRSQSTGTGPSTLNPGTLFLTSNGGLTWTPAAI